MVGAGDTDREGRGLGVLTAGRMLSAGDTLWYDEMLSEMVLTPLSKQNTFLSVNGGQIVFSEKTNLVGGIP